MPKTLYDAKVGDEILVRLFDGEELLYVVKRKGGGWRDNRSEETNVTLQRKELV